jgi:hypothetical protein
MTNRNWTVARRLGLLVVAAAAAMTGARQPGEKAGATADLRPSLPKVDDKLLLDPKTAQAAADLLEAGYQGKQPPEAMRMLLAILRGSRMGAGEGWFGPAQTRFTWPWLASLHGVDPATGAVARTAFKGPDALFTRLDRDKDGQITADDLDWSERSPFVQQTAMVRNWFRKMNTERTGELTKKEWMEFFEKAAKGKETLTPDELRDALLQGGPRRMTRPDVPKGAMAKMAANFRSTLVRGLFAGEIGSMNEGPKVGQPAPNFTLKAVDGKGTVQLANVLGKKPVVLVFGNYTCGPFCNSYPSVEPVAKRFEKDASFLMVYVREAHPSDGWSMGEEIKQPTTFDERVAVAQQFCKRASPTIPVLVDEMNDPAGHAYSGMPSRLYVIDPKGVVAYKSGRGPFGFRVEEMEQALAMALLEAQLPTPSAQEKAP